MKQRQELIRPWTSEEEDLLRKTYPTTSDEEIRRIFGRSIESIKGKVYRLRIRRDWRVIKEKLSRKTKERWARIKEGQKNTS
ncbi:hypothetical protein COV22_01140 [Candidatus Woesearchaeota archaeon CG10_big_fil_rev_8_21_14_0_10_47_5]|nr:MAG: hypothetical protein COV22_01140 [Candidatus Woesearchaeota archaeon CG10_big_fil_rev_8_21_14_0_10_47_5]